MDMEKATHECLICKEILTYFRHIMRVNGLEKNIDVLDKIEGRPAMSWLEEVKKTTRRSLDELISTNLQVLTAAKFLPPTLTLHGGVIASITRKWGGTPIYMQITGQLNLSRTLEDVMTVFRTCCPLPSCNGPR
ncbi:hypothetical protein LAZ67_16000145 [Cordylochernes scorpioides]|uniref:Uncharacterized protein n=1 Tax=Cordylochernes scorpioides TaxID=51811 RepID=A0ABY6LAD2_9ARAC|nr:hypothetical protein LAZ67_16000145 [Cordylochernes scorpioides]